MAGILELLGENNVQKIVQGISQEIGISQTQATSVVNVALPILIEAMQKNTTETQGATNLLNALQSSKHNGSLLDNLSEIFKGGINESVMNDGVGVLGHLLGGNNTTLISNAISKKTGVSANKVTQILTVLSSILMSYLGKQVTSKNVTTTKGLETLLNSTLGSSKGGNIIASLLDTNGDGSILDDVAGLVLGSNKTPQKGGIGNIIGNLFKSK